MQIYCKKINKELFKINLSTLLNKKEKSWFILFIFISSFLDRKYFS